VVASCEGRHDRVDGLDRVCTHCWGSLDLFSDLCCVRDGQHFAIEVLSWFHVRAFISKRVDHQKQKNTIANNCDSRYGVIATLLFVFATLRDALHLRVLEADN